MIVGQPTPTYRVVFVTGDYRARQERANQLGAALYLEGHANSSTNQRADYAMCVVGSNASATSKEIGRELAAAFGTAFDVGGDKDTDVGYGDGIRQDGRGDGNVRYTDMPAVLMEPGFCSNPEQARLMESEDGLNTAARIIFNTVSNHITSGATIVLSVGHIGKRSAPNDRGAVWLGERFDTEAAYAHAYMNRAAVMLRGRSSEIEAEQVKGPDPKPEPTPKHLYSDLPVLFRHTAVEHPSGARILASAVICPSHPMTLPDVQDYQRQHGLKPDGIIGPATWEPIVLSLLAAVRERA